MQIIYRTCKGFLGSNKPRPKWFRKDLCLDNLLKVFGPEHDLHIIADGYNSTCHPVWGSSLSGRLAVEWPINKKHNALAFLEALRYACQLQGNLYLVEDDFLHRPGAAEVLQDGLRHFDFITAYDHPDKFIPGHIGYETEKDIIARPVLGQWCHYKHTCSTVMTFAVKADTLREDADIFRKYATGPCTLSHYIFGELRSRGRTIGSAIPSYSTHCESGYLAPLVDWEAVSAG